VSRRDPSSALSFAFVQIVYTISIPIFPLVIYELHRVLQARSPAVQLVMGKRCEGMPCGCSSIDEALPRIVRALKTGTWNNFIGRLLMRKNFLRQFVRYLCQRNISMSVIVRDKGGVRSFGSSNSDYVPKMGGNMESFSFETIFDALDGLSPQVARFQVHRWVGRDRCSV